MHATPNQHRVFVAARLKPVGKEATNDLKIEGNRLFLVDDKRDYVFDAIFDKNATQVEVFNGVAEKIVSGCLEGFNGTIFAYGQTGAGKTHTMYGSEDERIAEDLNHGIVPRAAQMLFDGLRAKKQEYGERFRYEIKCSFLEVYNEVLADLFDPTGKPVVSDRGQTVQLRDAELRSCDSVETMLQFIKDGCSRRHVARTAMNEHSSRSHSIFTIHLVGKSKDDKVRGKRARLNLVDLAGSEKLDDSKAVDNRQKETANINKSLLQLGRVVRLLAKPQNTSHIPYRDSKLTHLLKDSLGGNSRTAFVIQLDLTHKQATLKSAEFAKELRLVKNQVHVNEDLESKNNFKVHPCWQELGDENAALRAENTKLRNELDTLFHQCDELRAKNSGLRTVAPTPQTAMSQKNRLSTAIFNGCAGNAARPHAVVAPLNVNTSEDAEMTSALSNGNSLAVRTTQRRKRMANPTLTMGPFTCSAYGDVGPSSPSPYVDWNVIELRNSAVLQKGLQRLCTPIRINHNPTDMGAALDVPPTPENAADGFFQQLTSILRSDKRPRMCETESPRITFDVNTRIRLIPNNRENQQANSSLNEFRCDARDDEASASDARPPPLSFDLTLSSQEEMRLDSSKIDMALDIDDSMPDAIDNEKNLHVPDEASEKKSERQPNLPKQPSTPARKQAATTKADERLQPTSSSLRRSPRRAPYN